MASTSPTEPFELWQQWMKFNVRFYVIYHVAVRMGTRLCVLAYKPVWPCAVIYDRIDGIFWQKFDTDKRRDVLTEIVFFVVVEKKKVMNWGLLDKSVSRWTWSREYVERCEIFNNEQNITKRQLRFVTYLNVFTHISMAVIEVQDQFL